MMRLLAISVLALLPSPILVAAEKPCGCGETEKPAANSRGGCACPLFLMDVEFWYCDYYEDCCISVPTAAWMEGNYEPCWECVLDPNRCPSTYGKTEHSRTKSHGSYGCYSGNLMAPGDEPTFPQQKVTVTLKRKRPVQFKHPVTGMPAFAIVFTYELSHPDFPNKKTRYVAYEVARGAPNPHPVPDKHVIMKGRVVRFHLEDMGIPVTAIVRLACANLPEGTR
ncbi:MAG: hypothetical protein GXY83_13880 [Rhodopirellula sp.]|nr:hypothetical protein [Rhodopirellula sp.]